MHQDRKSLTIGLGLLVALAAAVAARSQTPAGTPPAARPAIEVVESRAISADNPRAPHAETFAAVNPANPDNLLATSFAVQDGAIDSIVYASLDRGRTWRRSRSATGDELVFKGGDPVVYFDAKGVAYFSTIHGTPIGFLLSRSQDGGLTWQAPYTVPGGTYDRQYLAFDATGGAFDGRVYASGAVSAQEMDGTRHFIVPVVHSVDGGRTFRQPKFIDSAGTGYRIFGIADLLVTPDGTLVVLVETYGNRPNDPARSPGRLWTLVSEDGGLSVSPARPGPDIARGSGARWQSAQSARRAAVDISNGPYRGRIYATWMEFAGDKYNVRVASSSDLGRTWSAPVIVNDNTGANVPSNPAIAVNRSGAVAVIFNDRRDDKAGECFRLYAAASLDGGETFSPNVRVHEGSACPNAAGNWPPIAYSFLDMPLDLTKEPRRPAISISGIPARFSNGGDTQGLVAGPDGTFHAAWINGETGVMQLWYSALKVDGAARPPAAAGRRDYSRELTLEVSTPAIDFAARTVTVNVRIVNPTPVSVTGPFTVVADDTPRSSLEALKVSNATNGLPGKGATWIFADRSIAAGAKSAPQRFVWTFAGGVPADQGEPLRAHFLILGPEGGVAPPRR